MTVIASIHIEHDRLGLIPTLRALEGVEIKVITQTNTSPGATVFPFLIEYDDPEELDQMLEEDPTVESCELIDRNDGAGIYYIEHTPDTTIIGTIVTDVNGILVHTETTGNGWLVRLLLPNKKALSTIWEYARENDIALDIIEIYSNDDTGTERSYGLTDEQERALATAYEQGYFGEPRDILLSEMAEEMGLSSSAMSGRLRRGMRNLIAATIVDHEDIK